MRILFIHNNFPGQFRRISSYIAVHHPNVRLAVATLETNLQKFNLPKITYRPHRLPTNGIHQALITTEQAIILGQAAYMALLEIKKAGERPDIILAHSGMGASLFMKDLFPDAKLLNYYEWYYQCQEGNLDLYSKAPIAPDDVIRARIQNTPILHDLATQDWGQTPTRYQHSKFPEIFRDRISIIHDGIDTDYFKPNHAATVQINEKLKLTTADEVITYVARGMDECRGFPQFMQAVSTLQKLRPRLQAVVLGKDRIAYGPKRPDGKGMKEWALDKYDYDMKRLHFMGLQPISVFRALMQISSAHIYLTAPYVLSWSMLEAMSTGGLIIGSDTEPVSEVIIHGRNGLLVPFFDHDILVEQIIRVIENPADFVMHRQTARQTIIDNYAANDLMPRHWRLIQTVASGSQPAPDLYSEL